MKQAKRMTGEVATRLRGTRELIGIDSIIYDRARRACREANEDLQLGSFNITHGSVSRKLVESTPIRIVKPRHFTADSE
jgi:hypothetical protein